MTLGLITARGGSAGIPRKNIALAGGRPLIAWTIEAALGSRRLHRVIVSTDDDEIADVCRAHRAEVPFMRPAALAGPASPHILAVEHAIDWVEAQGGARVDVVVLLQPTSPLRTAADIDAAIDLFDRTGAPGVVSVSESPHHPWKMHAIGADGRLTPFLTSGVAYQRRQNLPPAFVENGAVYVTRADALRRERSFFPAGVVGYVMPPARSIDIDTPADLVMFEALLAAPPSH